jgi:predicted NBD/HSP70 family sugar kinase
MLGDVRSMTLMDFAGQIRGQRLGAMPSMTRPAVIDRLRQFMAELIAESGIEPRRLIGAGVGFAGFYVEGRVFNPPTYLDDWALVDIEPILADALKMPVIADNSSTVAAIGESLFGVGRRHDSFAYLHLSNGFGGGIITDGEPRRGVNRNAGEFGGIWTQFGATYANLDLLQTCLRARGHDFATVAEMARSVDLGWAGVDDWLDLAVPSFTLLCNVLTYTIDPGLIVIGGQLPRRIAQELAKRITVRVATDRRGHPPPVPQVVAAEASGEPVCLGAAVMPLRTAFFA